MVIQLHLAVTHKDLLIYLSTIQIREYHGAAYWQTQTTRVATRTLSKYVSQLPCAPKAGHSRTAIRWQLHDVPNARFEQSNELADLSNSDPLAPKSATSFDAAID